MGQMRIIPKGVFPTGIWSHPSKPSLTNTFLELLFDKMFFFFLLLDITYRAKRAKVDQCINLCMANKFKINY